MNSALPSAPEEADRQMFLHLVDRFTAWHLRLLRLAIDPIAWFEAHSRVPRGRTMGAFKHIIDESFPELARRDDLMKQIWSELHEAGLESRDNTHTTMSVTGLFEQGGTPRGRAFLTFITAPIAVSP